MSDQSGKSTSQTRSAVVEGVQNIVTTGDRNIIIISTAAELIKQWLQDRKPTVDFRATTEAFLEDLFTRYRFLDFKGMGVDDKIPLRLALMDMYVPLKARIEVPQGETWERKLKLAGREMTPDELRETGERISAPVYASELLKKYDGLVVLGDPGAGKTTFIKYLCLQLASGKGDALGLGLRLPVMIPLSAYANAIDARDMPIHQFIEVYYRNRGIQLDVGDMLNHALKTGNALILLDGLDEVHSLPLRHAVVDRVIDFFTFHRKKGNGFVLTSRIVGYREVRPTAEGLKECTIIDFDEEEISLFIDKWVGAVERAAFAGEKIAEYEAAREKQELMAAVKRNPGVRELASNPLLLTILALMKRQGVALPERRVELYQKYVETLLRHWNLVRGLERRSRRDLDLLETLRILAPLALWMHETSPGVGLVKQGEVRRKLFEIYQHRGVQDPEIATETFLSDVREFAALLLERGPGVYGFIHLTFQEYLAAVAVAKKGQLSLQPVADTLVSHAADDNWNEIARLTVACMGIVEQREEAAGAVLEAMLKTDPDKLDAVTVLAGKAVQDAWPGGITPESREKVIEALIGTMRNRRGTTPPPLRVAAGAVLAKVGDPRPEAMTLHGMQFCMVPAGPFLMGSDKKLDPNADDNEMPQHKVDLPLYFISRYPVTNAQFQFFVDDGGYDHRDYWIEAEREGVWKEGRVKDWLDDDFRNKPRDRGHPFNLANHPVYFLNWYEAMAYARWLDEKWRKDNMLPENMHVTLPSEAEWEKAARGGLSIIRNPLKVCPGDVIKSVNPQIDIIENAMKTRIYPWGNQADHHMANVKETGIGSTSAVGCFPSDVSPYGCEDMAGNANEWTRSLYKSYPYVASDGREAVNAFTNNSRISWRGGAYNDDITKYPRCGCRGWYNPYFLNAYWGFRLSLSPFL